MVIELLNIIVVELFIEVRSCLLLFQGETTIVQGAGLSGGGVGCGFFRLKASEIEI